MFKIRINKCVVAEHGGTSLSSAAIIGIAVGSAFLVLLLVGLGVYALWQKKRAERAIGLSKPFGTKYLLSPHSILNSKTILLPKVID